MLDMKGDEKMFVELVRMETFTVHGTADRQQPFPQRTRIDKQTTLVFQISIKTLTELRPNIPVVITKITKCKLFRLTMVKFSWLNPTNQNPKHAVKS